MSDLRCFVQVSSNATATFTNSIENDFMIFTEANTQKILIGPNLGSNAALTITSNVVGINGSLSFAGSIPIKGLNISMADNTSTTISSISSVTGFSNDANGVVLSMPNNTSNDSFRFVANSVEAARITGDGNLMVANNISADNLGMFRNRIINGDMRIDQRFSGAAQTGKTASMYVTDRWNFEMLSCGTYTLQQVSDAPTGFTHSLKATLTATATPISTSYLLISQRIEGYNIADFAFGTNSATPITVSFWAKSSIAGTYGFGIDNDYNGGRGYVSTFTINQVGTWEKKTIYVPGDTTGTWANTSSTGMRICIGLGSGANYQTATTNSWQAVSNKYATSGCVQFSQQSTNSTFQLTGVQVEKGTMATPFEYRPYALELLLCQRYYEIVVPSTLGFTNFAMGTYGPGGANNLWFNFKVSKRATPTLATGSVTTAGGTLTSYYTAEMVAFRVDTPANQGFYYGVGIPLAFAAEL